MSAAVPAATRAVFFDVDFTLIHPGPAFQGSGYRDACARHGIAVDPARFDTAVTAAACLLNTGSAVYDPQVYVDYTQRIIEQMGGTGDRLAAAARDIYDQWGACQHFTLYDDVQDVLRELHGRGLKIGLISNTERCLDSFQQHFELQGLFDVTVSSAAHGYMKPHPSIFEAALRAVDASAEESVMVGDSLAHDVEGARRLGMRGVLLSRSGAVVNCPADVPMIRSLRELPSIIL